VFVHTAEDITSDDIECSRFVHASATENAGSPIHVV